MKELLCNLVSNRLDITKLSTDISLEYCDLFRPHLNVTAVSQKSKFPHQPPPDRGFVTTATARAISSLELADLQVSKPVQLAASQSVRVRVEKRLLLVPVPVPEQLTIGWLACEAAKRYFR